MSWTNPPTKVTEARDRLLESSTIATTLGMVTSNAHFPRALPSDTLPLMVIERSETSVSRQTNGGSFRSGSIIVVLAVDARTVTDGTLEQYAESICQDITELQTDGLWVVRATAGRSGSPGPGFFAAENSGQPDGGNGVIRTIPITIEWADG